jgi:hypothetical protein
MTQTVGRYGGPADPAPQNIEQMIERVRGWHDERGRWFVTKKGPDGTGFPPSWPLTYEETAELVLALGKDRESLREAEAAMRADALRPFRG